jgi:hypothetical protein
MIDSLSAPILTAFIPALSGTLIKNQTIKCHNIVRRDRDVNVAPVSHWLALFAAI